MAGFAACVAAFTFCIGSIWYSEARHFHVDPAPISDEAIARSRTEPSDALLAAIGAQDLSLPVALSPEEAVASAEAILRGRLVLDRFEPQRIDFPFSPRNLDLGLPSFQLHVASLVTASLLLRASATTGDERFFRGALQDLLAFSRYERGQLVPRGVLWNDHAVAARISTVIRLWRAYRTRPDFDDETARTLLGLVARSGELLSKPSEYNARTNHGVMQDLALLQIASAFPALPNASTYGRVGCQRLTDQLRYYVSPAGVVLEHSAGYQRFGARLLDFAVELGRLNGCPALATWEQKRSEVEAFLRLLTLPDGSLPVFGDTEHRPPATSDADAVQEAEREGPPPRPSAATTFLPVEGYAVWWSGLDRWPGPLGIAQTIVAWSRFPNQAHKLADDMSVLIWAAGRAWITTTGYWPYGAPHQHDAMGWRGANAPHTEGEAASSRRITSATGEAEASGLRFVDLISTREELACSFRRQVLEVEPSAWLVLDSADAPKCQPVERVWTAGPGVRVEAIDGQSFLFAAPSDDTAMKVTLQSDRSVRAEVYSGSVDPFAGWLVVAGHPTPAPAIDVRQPEGSRWLVTRFLFGTRASLGSGADGFTASFAAPSDWQAHWAAPEGELRIERAGAELLVHREGGRDVRTRIEPILGADDGREEIIRTYLENTARYPSFPGPHLLRVKLTFAAFLLAIAQEVALLFVRRLRRGWVRPLRAVAAAAWLLAGLWISKVYLT